MENLKFTYITNDKLDFESRKTKLFESFEKTINKTWEWNDFLGWMDLDNIVSEQELNNIKEVSKKFRNNFEKIVVIWIWGSYLWAKAIIESLKWSFEEDKIIFAWYNLDSSYLHELINYLEDKNYAIVVISKSWTTLEPALSFRILLENLKTRFWEDDIKNRVIAITDKNKWVLKELSNNMWLQTFVVPDDIWWRFSVLTAVWLLPLAIAWYDIGSILNWAKDVKKLLIWEKDISKNPAFSYVLFRNILLEKWKNIEVLVNFDMKLKYISSWWKQLFWESEWKDWKWIFPTNLDFTTDLHSVWQYIQDWQKIIFETFLEIENKNIDLKIPFVENDTDKLNYLSWKTINFTNSGAMEWTMSAHLEWWVSVWKISIPELNEYYIWQLIYFFEFSCALSSYMIDVNPFNQPGVENYKKYMMNNLIK